MSIREVTYYQVACDEPGCGLDTGSLGHDYSAWSDRDGAVDAWEEVGNGVVFDDGRAYCEEHRRSHTCEGCGENDVVVEVDGQWYCRECREEMGA